MKQLVPFFFGDRSEFKLRPATEQDHALIAEMIEGDEDHRGRVDPAFFYEDGAGVDSYCLEDDKGAVFFLRITRTVRLDIQFQAPVSTEVKERTQRGLVHGFAWLKGVLAVRGIREAIFESRVPVLRRFCERRLGFLASSEEMVCKLPSIEAYEGPEIPLQRQQGNSGRTV